MTHFERPGSVLAIAILLVFTAGCDSCFYSDVPAEQKARKEGKVELKGRTSGKTLASGHYAVSDIQSLNASEVQVTLPQGPSPASAPGVRAQTVPPPVVFNGFQADSGRLRVNISEQLTFEVPLTGSGNNGCFDFFSDGCDAQDVNITYDPAQKTLNFSEFSYAPEDIFGMDLILEVPPELGSIAQGPGGLSDIVITVNPNSQPIQLLVPFAPGLVGYMTTLPVGEEFGLRVATVVVIANPNAADTTVRLDFFNSEDGLAFPLQVNGAPAATNHEFQAPANSTSRLELTQTGSGLKTAWGLITSGSDGLNGSVVYSTFRAGEGGELLGEAGVTTVVEGTHHVLDVHKTADGFDTALAIVNPTGQTTELRLTLKDRNNTTVGEDFLSIEARQQTGFFPLVGADTFSGSLIIDSSSSVAVNTLRTKGGIQTSSLEAASF